MTMEEDKDIYTQDGTLDIHKKPANKNKTGTWKACRFILGILFKPLTFCCNKKPKYRFLFCSEFDLIVSMINWQELSAVKDWLTME